jgi:hypothetical protein
MVITGIELERAPIIEGIEIFKIRKFRRNGNRPPLSCQTVKNLNFVAMFLKGGREID